MRRHRALLPALLLPVLLLPAACRTLPPEPSAPIESVVGESWRGTAQPEDVDRYDRLDEAWRQALGQVGRSSSQVNAAGDLLRPDSALPRAALPPGSYRCRLFRFRRTAGGRGLAVFPPFFCYVGAEAEGLNSFAKQTGSERPAGYVWAESDLRGVFLGATAVGDDPAPAYGSSSDRNLVGIVERVGPFRYRLVMPWPRNGAILDVIELVPYVTDTF